MCKFKEKRRSAIQLFLFYTQTTKTSWTWQTQNFSLWEWERSIELNTPHPLMYPNTWCHDNLPPASSTRAIHYSWKRHHCCCHHRYHWSRTSAECIAQCQQGGSRGDIKNADRFWSFPCFKFDWIQKIFLRWSSHVFFPFFLPATWSWLQLWQVTPRFNPTTRTETGETRTRNCLSSPTREKQRCMHESTKCEAVLYASWQLSESCGG